MATFVTLHGLHGSVLRSQFLSQDHHLTHHHFPLKHPSTANHNKPQAKFNIVEIMGGRGICNGELGIQKELERQVDDPPPPPPAAAAAEASEKEQENSGGNGVAVPEDAFEKEMMGLTGGFPGGEKGLIKFIEENPPSNPGNVLTLSK